MKKNILIIFLVFACIASFAFGVRYGYSHGNQTLKVNATVDDESKDDVTSQKVDMLKEYVLNNYLQEVSEDKLNDGMLKGIVSVLDDPYSQYMNEEEFNRLIEDLSGKFNGIGVVVTAGDDNYITVVSPIDGTPADRAGIVTGDRIIKVEGQEFYGSTMSDAIRVIKGEAGTSVTITVRRYDSDNEKVFNEFDLTLVREEITVSTVTSEMLTADVGYLRLSQFDEGSGKEFKDHMKKLEDVGAKGIVLDLRNNPGGLLSTAQEIADYLLGEGIIVYTERRGGVRNETLTSDAKMNSIPMTVLINGGSASASEILSGAIRDHSRAILIGEKSFGKGIVQNITPFDDGTGVKLTESEYFTPNGTKIHKIGITPDIVVELPKEVTQIGPENKDNDVQLLKAISEVEKLIK